MDKKKIVILISFVVVIVLLAILLVISISDSNQGESQNEIGKQNTNRINEINTSEDENEISENVLNNENQSNTGIIENNTQVNTTNNNEENSNKGSENMQNQNEEIKVNLIVNNKTFTATLNNNETTRELTAMFPMTLNMSDLHSNEKYNYLDSSFTTNSSRPSRINAGDIKLYGNNCLVVFYESFSNSYSYTDLGRVDNVNSFVSELGSGNVNIRFELAN